MRPRLIALSLTVLLVAALAPTAIAVPRHRQIKPTHGPSLRERQRFVRDQVVVQFHRRIGATERREVNEAVGARVVAELLLPNTYVVELERRLSVRDGVGRYRDHSAVKNASPNYLRYKLATPNDPLFTSLWGLNNTGQTVEGVAGTADKDIDAPEAWNTETGDAGVLVGVIDDGVNYGHPDLDGNIFNNAGDPLGGGDQDGNGLVDDFRGWDFSSMTGSSPGDNNPMGPDTHGTHVAGTIGAEGNNATGITGVSQDVSLLPIRIFNDNGGVPLGAVVNAFVYAGMMGADVANGSFGGPGGSALEVEALEFSKNTLFVFAAGNDGANNSSSSVYPCNYGAELVVDNVICVAATNSDDLLADFSNIGPDTVHIAAPGTAILSTSRHATLVEEGFEGAHGWTLDSPWASTTELSFAGIRSLTDSPGAPYATGALDKSAQMPVDDYSGMTGCVLDYLVLHSLEAGDVVRVEGSTDGGATWPHLLRTIAGNNPGYPGFGASHTTSLAPLNGDSNGRVRFRLLSDGDGAAGPGIHLDELSVRCNSASGTDGGYQYLQGTSMAAPHVAGAAALLFANQPGANPFSARLALMNSGDLLPVSEAGQIISNRRLNADALLDQDATPLAVPSVSSPTLSQVFQKKTSVSVSSSTLGAAGYWIKVDRTRYNSLNFSRSFLSSSGTRTVSLPAGSTYCISSNSIEPVTANESNFSTRRCTAVPVNNTSLKHSNGWSKKSGSGTFLNSYSQSKKKGATLSLSGVFFDRLALVATKCRGCGKVGLFFGKQKVPFKTISLGATKTKKLQIITAFNKSGGPFKSKVTIKVLTSGKLVKIEGLGVFLKPFI